VKKAAIKMKKYLAKFVHHIHYMYQQLQKELIHAYFVIIPSCLILAILGYPFFNLSFILAAFALPLVCSIIAIPSMSFLKFYKQRKHIENRFIWGYIDCRYNRKD